MSAHILTAAGDVRTEARRLLERLVEEKRVGGKLPDVDRQGDSTVVVIDPDLAGLIPEFEKIGFVTQRDEDSH
jgi:hypothetical protein